MSHKEKFSLGLGGLNKQWAKENGALDSLEAPPKEKQLYKLLN
jgi:hypothetical protein